MEEDLKIVAVRMDSDGEIKKVKLTDGRVLTRDEAVQLCQDDGLPGYHTQTSRLGHTFIASNRNLDRSDNLQNLPTF